MENNQNGNYNQDFDKAYDTFHPAIRESLK